MMRDLTQSSGSQAVSAPRSAAISAAPKSNAAGLMVVANYVVQGSHCLGRLDKRDDLGRLSSLSQQVVIKRIVAEESHFGRTEVIRFGG